MSHSAAPLRAWLHFIPCHPGGAAGQGREGMATAARGLQRKLRCCDTPAKWWFPLWKSQGLYQPLVQLMLTEGQQEGLLSFRQMKLLFS